MQQFKLVVAALGMLLSFSSLAQSTKPKDYLGVAGPITFEKSSYNLAWTSHPSDNYYKQEYLMKGDTVASFKKMVVLEVLTGNTTPKDAAAAKIAELDKLKESNPIVNYNIYQKNGEIMLDFLISENKADGSISILERNVYRYKSVSDKTGKNCLLLFAVSERAYGKDADTFLKGLKANKAVLTNAVAAFKIPEITLSK